MTPRDRAEKIVERFLSTPEGFAPDDKQAPIAAIEQGMNGVIDEAVKLVDWKVRSAWALHKCSISKHRKFEARMLAQSNEKLRDNIRALKSPDNSRNTITDNQKD